MSLHVAVEASRRCKMMDTTDYSEFCQSLESPVHGCSRDARNSLLHLSENLIDSRMIIALEQSRVNYAPLHRDGHSFAPARSLETLIIRILSVAKLSNVISSCYSHGGHGDASDLLLVIYCSYLVKSTWSFGSGGLVRPRFNARKLRSLEFRGINNQQNHCITPLRRD